jgi:hypothetical protein
VGLFVGLWAHTAVPCATARRYAAMVPKVVGQHQEQFVEAHNITYDVLSNDNGFLPYTNNFLGTFEQRTLIARWMHVTVVSHRLDRRSPSACTCSVTYKRMHVYPPPSSARTCLCHLRAHARVPATFEHMHVSPPPSSACSCLCHHRADARVSATFERMHVSLPPSSARTCPRHLQALTR